MSEAVSPILPDDICESLVSQAKERLISICKAASKEPDMDIVDFSARSEVTLDVHRSKQAILDLILHISEHGMRETARKYGVEDLAALRAVHAHVTMFVQQIAANTNNVVRPHPKL